MFRVEINSTLIGFLEVMANMQEGSSLKGITKVTDFSVSGNESSEPIICDTNCWDLLSLAHVLETSLVKGSNLLSYIVWWSVRVWTWEYVTIVQENNLDTFYNTLMDTKGHSSSNINVNIINISNSCWILSKISSLTLSISFIIRRDNNNILTKICKTNR